MSTNASSASSDKAPVLHEIDHDSTKPWTTEQVFASFNNLLTFALLLQKPALAQKCNLSFMVMKLHANQTSPYLMISRLDGIQSRLYVS